MPGKLSFQTATDGTATLTERMSINSAGLVSIPGSLTVTGDLIINGTTTNINTTNLVVEDKNIILGDVTTPSNTTADGGGITLKGATDKTFNWVNSTAAWTSSEPIIANSFIPSSSTVPTNGMYLSAANTLNFATNTTNRMVIDSSGNIGIGTTPTTGYSIQSSKNLTGAVTTIGFHNSGTVQSDVTTAANVFYTTTGTAAASFTLANLRHYMAVQGTFGAGSSVTNQIGFMVNSNVIGATNNYGFYGDIPSGSNRWNIYMNGTANNYLAGGLGIGSTNLTGVNLRIGKTLTGSTTGIGALVESQIQSDVTSVAKLFNTYAQTQSANFAISQIAHLFIDGTSTFANVTAGGTVGAQYGVYVGSSITGASSNYAFYSEIASGANRWNIYMNGTAPNYLAGTLGIGATPTYGILDISASAPTLDIISNSFKTVSTKSAGIINFRSGGNSGERNNPVAAIEGYDEYTGGGYDGSLRFKTQSNANLYERMRITPAGFVFINNTANNLGGGGIASQVVIIPSNASYVGTVIRAAASQTADLQQWQNSAGGNITRIDAYGRLGITSSLLANSTGGFSQVSIANANTTDTQLVIKSYASQTANLQEWQNSSGTAIGTMSPSGAFTAITKSFDIPHPTKENMRLRYGSLEGPENGVYIRGNTKNKVIELPDYWTGLVNESTITVTLTSIGKFQKVYVEKIEDNKVYIGGRVKEISYVIFGERKDTDKLTVEY
jgi:predicted outer membrane repeat protein